MKCEVCGHDYGDHYTTNDGSWSGCAECLKCKGYQKP